MSGEREPKLDRIKLSHLRDVLAVAEHGSLRAAGRHLQIAQPAITRSIREVEHELGVTLFERHAKGVKLTTMGESFVRRAESIQSELRRAREELEQLKGLGAGEVSVALSQASSIALMPRALAAFRKRYPKAVLKISESLFQPVEAQILDGRLDFYVGPLDQPHALPKFDVEQLFENRRVVIARKGHPLAGATSLRDLVNAQWVRPTMSTRVTEGDFDAMFERLGLPQPQIVLHARSGLVTLLTVANSDLLSVLPQQWLEIPQLQGMFQALEITEPMAAAPICIVRRRDMPLTPMAEHLRDLMQRFAAQYSNAKARQAP